MNAKKTYAVFGLGRYGTAVARELVDNGMLSSEAREYAEAITNILMGKSKSDSDYDMVFSNEIATKVMDKLTDENSIVNRRSEMILSLGKGTESKESAPAEESPKAAESKASETPSQMPVIAPKTVEEKNDEIAIFFHFHTFEDVYYNLLDIHRRDSVCSLFA